MGQCGINPKYIGVEGRGLEAQVLGMTTSKKPCAFKQITSTLRGLYKTCGSQVLACVRITWRAC